jgi:hypothetical protein
MRREQTGEIGLGIEAGAKAPDRLPPEGGLSCEALTKQGTPTRMEGERGVER